MPLLWRFKTFCCIEFKMDILKVKSEKEDPDTLQQEKEPTLKVHL